MPANYEDKILPGNEFAFERRYNTGDTYTFKGDRALALSDLPEAEEWRRNNPEKYLLNSYEPDMRDSQMYQWGSKLRDNVGKNGFFGKIADKGILAGATAGGALGAGGGALAGLLAKLFLKDVSLGKWALLGGLAGSILGGHNGYVRRNSDRVQFLKSAATYTDPRNFILEKLEGATDIGIGEKVKLAHEVRNLDRSSAEKLAALVRSALGFGVGAIISKFILGSTGVGTLFGGLMGAIGTNLLMNSFNNRPTAPTFDFNFRPLSYKDIL